MAQAEELFQARYQFVKDGVTVVLQTPLDKNLRHKPGQKAVADADGGFGKLARFTANIRKRNGNLEATFKNNNSDKYLRIMDGKVDIDGGGGKWCWFRVHKQNAGIVKLESAETDGSYLAVDKNGVRVGKGGPWCRFTVFREGKAEPFSKPYFFAKVNTVVIEHRDEKHLRVMNGKIDSDGGKGEFAQWEATPGDNKTVRLKNIKHGKYLRIKPNNEVDCDGGEGPLTLFKVIQVDAPNHVRLESHRFAGKFLHLAPAKKSLKSGEGKNKTSLFTFYREN